MKKSIMIAGFIFALCTTPVWGGYRIEITRIIRSPHAVGGSITASPPRAQKPRVVPTPPDSVDTYYDVIYDTIHLLESTRGKAPSGHHIYCRKRGMWNEIGYNPQGKFCFKNEAEGKAKVKNWFTDKIERGYSIYEAACLWNTGRRITHCAYAQHF